MREIKPKLVHKMMSDQWYPLSSRDDDEGMENRRGEIRVQISYERMPAKKLTPHDFEYLKLIGRGTFGRVFQVRKKDTKRIYAMKVLSKREIALKKEVTHTMGERKILEKSLDCPFLVGLKFSFQSATELYFVTDYKSGGELFWHLQREGRFTRSVRASTSPSSCWRSSICTSTTLSTATSSPRTSCSTPRATWRCATLA